MEEEGEEEDAGDEIGADGAGPFGAAVRSGPARGTERGAQGGGVLLGIGEAGAAGFEVGGEAVEAVGTAEEAAVVGGDVSGHGA